jgi:hypothetical protein
MSPSIEEILRAEQLQEATINDHDANQKVLTEDEAAFVKVVIDNIEFRGGWTTTNGHEARRERMIFCGFYKDNDLKKPFEKWRELIASRLPEGIDNPGIYSIAFIPLSSYDRAPKSDRDEMELNAVRLAQKELEHTALDFYRGILEYLNIQLQEETTLTSGEA